MEVEINLMGVLLGAVSSMIVGGLWYSDALFGKPWAKMAGIDKDKQTSDAGKALSGMFLLALVMAYVLAHVSYLSAQFFTDQSFLYCAISSGFWMWLGFVLPVTASNSLFEQKRKKLSAIHAGNWLATLLVMGWVIGAVGL
jgi:hypothetical protein